MQHRNRINHHNHHEYYRHYDHNRFHCINQRHSENPKKLEGRFYTNFLVGLHHCFNHTHIPHHCVKSLLSRMNFTAHCPADPNCLLHLQGVLNNSSSVMNVIICLFGLGSEMFQLYHRGLEFTQM